jgi:anaphase-promoting complex subunit 1
LFDWQDRVQAGDEREISAGEEQVQAQNQTSGLWLRRDFIEEARWQIWGVQSEDHEDGVDAA